MLNKIFLLVLIQETSRHPKFKDNVEKNQLN